MSKRRSLWWALALAFVVIPIIEIYVVIQVGQVIGAWWTIALLLLDGLIGSWLVKREGGRAWAALRTALHQGRMPAREIADGSLILIAGTLMLTPGFVSDIVGIFLILPLTRPMARRVLTRFVSARLIGPSYAASARGRAARSASGAHTTGAHQRPGDEVIPGVVIDD